MKYGGNSIWLGAALLSLGLPCSPAPAQVIPARSHAAVCGDDGPGTVHCTARVIVNNRGRPLVLPRQGNNSTMTAPYGTAKLLAAYNLTGKAPNRPIIAIVDAYDAPNIAADLASYNASYGIPALPVCAVPIASSPTPCFQKVDQRGGTVYPPVDNGWALEIALDVEIAHAICQNCGILLVEADTSDYGEMMAAVDLAAASGAVALSGSWGSSEFSGETALDVHFNHPGLAMTFAAGDSGYGTGYPAASPYVTAVGGTSLTSSGETGWILGGSGCSTYEPKPPWQKDTGCANRTIADIAAVADPTTGVAVYSSDYQSPPAWYQVGGTSLSTPVIAGVYALSGKLPAGVWLNSLPYMNPSALYDIVDGGNGGRYSCAWKNTPTWYLCHAGKGYDGPTGLGTPNGTGAF